MGRSAKLHKRIKKTSSSTTASQTSKPTVVTSAAPSTSTPIAKPQTQTPAAANVKRRSNLKAKATKRLAAAGAVEGAGGHVLGGADYVSLMMGSRRKAREEAEKLPRS